MWVAACFPVTVVNGILTQEYVFCFEIVAEKTATGTVLSLFPIYTTYYTIITENIIEA